jgi:hypothetical protein
LEQLYRHPHTICDNEITKITEYENIVAASTGGCNGAVHVHGVVGGTAEDSLRAALPEPGPQPRSALVSAFTRLPGDTATNNLLPRPDRKAAVRKCPRLEPPTTNSANCRPSAPSSTSEKRS